MEKEETRDFAIAKLAADLLLIINTLEMALKSAAAAALVDADFTSSILHLGPDSQVCPMTMPTLCPFYPPSSSSSSLPITTPPSTSTAASGSSPPNSALLKGSTLTHQPLLFTLASRGISPFTPTGETFDPNWHEALFEVPLAAVRSMPEGTIKVGEVMPGVIMDTFKVGYRIKDQWLKAAQVGVVG